MSGFVDLSRQVERPRLRLLCQLLATAAVLGWVPGNTAKLLAMVIVWRLGFGRVSLAELALMGGVNLLFVLLNSAALRRGVFAFEHPDWLGLPVYEYLMWGFYTLHAIRFLGGAAPPGRWAAAVAAAAMFALPFATIADPRLLLLASTATLAITFAVFHQPMDLAYAGYMAAMGALIELVGVSTAQWHYPGEPPGELPLWSLTMWAGVGLFTRRLLLPLLARQPAEPRPPAG